MLIMATEWKYFLSIISTIVFLDQMLAQQLKSFKILSEWKELEFEFPTQDIRENAILNNIYIPGNSVPIDVDIDYRGQAKSRVFVTIPRFTDGIPITLGILSARYGNNGPYIQAYPDYNWHSSHGRNCDGLTSVFRVAIDECQRLWVVDTGRISDSQLCPPQIVLFDLNTDRVIHRYKFPVNLFKPGVSLFVTPIVDVRDPGASCVNTMVYIADVTGFGIIVYDYKRNLAWRTQNKNLYPNPDNGTFTIHGESFDLMDGVLGLSLSPRDRYSRAFGFGGASGSLASPSTASNRILYFHALASITENRVPLSILDNVTAWNDDPDYSPRSFEKIGARGTQSAAEAMDSNGNLFFGLMDPIAIGCWDSSKPYRRENLRIVSQNDQTLQFASGMKVVMNKKGKEELWILTCRFQRVMTGSITSSEVNFRIQGIQIDDLLSGTKCAARNGLSVPITNFAFPQY